MFICWGVHHVVNMASNTQVALRLAPQPLKKLRRGLSKLL
jgi:hypothetical protein